MINTSLVSSDPFSEKFGRRLYDRYPGPKQLWEFPEDNHGSVMNRSPDFWKEVIAFWNANPR